MARWADYLISSVAYDTKHRIISIKQHKDTGESIETGEIIDRTTLVENLKDKISYIIIFSGLGTWKPGEKVRLFRVGNDHYIRIDKNKVKFDNLGLIPELKIEEKETGIDKSIEAKTEPPKPAPEPPKTEPPKPAPEPPKTEPPKPAPEPPKTEPPKPAPEPPKTEPPKPAPEPPKTEPPKPAPEPPKTEPPKPAPEPPKTEPPKPAPEPPKTEPPKPAPEPPKTEPPKPAPEPPKAETIKAETEILSESKDNFSPEQVEKIEKFEKQLQELEILQVEQLEKLEQLGKKLQEAVEKKEPKVIPKEEIKPEIKQLQKLRGSLPKGFETKISEEKIDVKSSPHGTLPKEVKAKPPSPEPEGTPEQLTQIEKLEKQIKEFEAEVKAEKLSKPEPTLPKPEPTLPKPEPTLPKPEPTLPKPEPTLPKPEPTLPKPEPTLPKPEPTLPKPVVEKESIDKEIEGLHELENEVKKLEKALQEISEENKTSTDSQEFEIFAYCVKCKTKRKIQDPQETTMKNGRPAVRGTCTECGTKVFRIGKLVKS